MSDENRWLTPPEVARVLEISDITARAWMDQGKLAGSFYKSGKRKVRRIYVWSVRELIMEAGIPERSLQRLDAVIAETWDGDSRRHKEDDLP